MMPETRPHLGEDMSVLGLRHFRNAADAAEGCKDIVEAMRQYSSSPP